MKKILAICCWSMMIEAFALTQIPETLPKSPWADTEVSTNVPFVQTGEKLKEFRFELALSATASNNVELALGHDDDFNGVLTPDETGFTFAWDCGKWVVNQEVSLMPVSDNPEKSLEWVLSMQSALPHCLSIVENAIAVPIPESLMPPAALFDASWNLMRITVRGVEEARERLLIKALPYAFALRIK